MIMQKILIISKVFFPNISARANRTTQLALEFARLGHEVTVMLPDLDVDYYRDYSSKTGIVFKTYGQTTWKPIKGDSFFKRVLARLSLMVFEYPDIQLTYMVKNALRNETGYDLLISVAVPHPIHWGVATAVKRNNNLCRVWAADCGDPYMGCRTDTFKKLFYFKYVEKRWCKQCNHIVVPVEEMRFDFYPEFRNKIEIIPQGFDLNEVDIKPFKSNDIVTFIYSGTLSLHYRNPLPFLSFLSKQNVDFKFIVYTNSDILNDYEKALNGKLEIRKYIPRKDLLIEMIKADFLVNFDNVIANNNSNKSSSSINDNRKSANTAYSLPSKLIDYSIVNRPVLSIGHNLNEPVIMEFLDRNYSHKMALPELSNYDIKLVAQKFLMLKND